MATTNSPVGTETTMRYHHTPLEVRRIRQAMEASYGLLQENCKA